MNSVSWLIYIGSIGDGSIPSVVGFFALLAAIGCTIGFYITNAPSMKEDKDVTYTRDVFRHVSRVAWVTGTIMWGITALLPNKNTMYAIAASQIGEQVLKSKAADVSNQALDALSVWIKNQTDGTKKP